MTLGVFIDRDLTMNSQESTGKDRGFWMILVMFSGPILTAIYINNNIIYIINYIYIYIIINIISLFIIYI